MSDAELSRALDIIRDRLYFVGARSPIQERPDLHGFTLDEDINSWPVFLDFGPVSLGCLYRFCQIMSAKLTDKALASKRIYFYCGPHMHKRANAAYLMAAYSVLYLHKTPEEAWKPFTALSPPLAPWHDASPTIDSFHLTTLDVLRGIAKARDCHFFTFENFNVEEYEHYEKVENGDMNWIVDGRFLAFAGPHDARACTPEGYVTTAVDDLVPHFKRKGVAAVVRLNKKYYNEKRFKDAAIAHHDMYYLDGSNPPEPILQRFLAVCEATTGACACGGAVAVCVAPAQTAAPTARG